MSSQPDFNALVLQMRAARTTESMMVLYKHLFEVDEWFFPADPKDPEEPMQWRFPEGANTTPCILGYTDIALAWGRATEVAASVGGIAGVMTVSVGDAVRWMTSGDVGVSWASFNYSEGFENFPLYFFQVEEMAVAFGVLATSSTS